MSVKIGETRIDASDLEVTDSDITAVRRPTHRYDRFALHRAILAASYPDLHDFPELPEGRGFEGSDTAPMSGATLDILRLSVGVLEGLTAEELAELPAKKYPLRERLADRIADTLGNEIAAEQIRGGSSVGPVANVFAALFVRAAKQVDTDVTVPAENPAIAALFGGSD